MIKKFPKRRFLIFFFETLNPKNKVNKRGLLGLLILFVMVVLAAGGFFAYKQIIANGVQIKSGNVVFNLDFNNKTNASVSFTGNTVNVDNSTLENETISNSSEVQNSTGNETASNLSVRSNALEIPYNKTQASFNVANRSNTTQ